ncbi:MAG: SpoIIIAH-like family protein [Lachnospirales bacterium]
MFAVKKNQVIITALVAMIAAAGYLNYIDSAPQKANEVMLTDNSDIAFSR